MLNDKQIQALKPKGDKGKYMVADKDGLFIAVYNMSGKKSFVFEYKNPKTSKRDRLTLGQYPQMSLERARKELLKLRYNLANNQSINEKVADKGSFFELSEQWLSVRNEVSERTIKNSRTRLANYCRKILDYKIDINFI